MSSIDARGSSTYELVAIKFATSQRRTSRENFLISRDLHDGPMPLDFFVWAAVSDERVILVDSGSDEGVCTRRGHQFLRCPAATMSELGLDPERVTDLIVTHMHWDHVGNLNKFPRARLHVHSSEMAHATGCGMCHPMLRRPYDVDEVCNLVRAVYDGRVHFNHGSCEIAAGITVHHVGGHTPGLQVVRVRTKRGYVVLASDAMHFYENASLGNPFPVIVDVQAYLEAFAKIDALADSPAHIIPGHDPTVLAIYPPWSEGTRGVAARLDVAPGALPASALV